MDLSIESAYKLTANLMHPIFDKITPHEVSDDYRALDIAKAYGKILAAKHNNLKIEEGALQKLVEGYPSHEHHIDILEAQTLFKEVQEPCSQMKELAIAINQIEPNLEKRLGKPLTIDSLSAIYNGK